MLKKLATDEAKAIVEASEQFRPGLCVLIALLLAGKNCLGNGQVRSLAAALQFKDQHRLDRGQWIV